MLSSLMVAEERITTKFSGLVVADPAAIAAHAERAREQISPAFRAIFDTALAEGHEQLLASPQDPVAKVRFVTLYHQRRLNIVGVPLATL